MSHFRFEDLQVWQDAIDVGDHLFEVAEKAESNRFFRFAEQLRAAGMSISNNISEGSGSFSKKEFAQVLNIARRSVFECANILYIFYRRDLITEKEKNDLLTQLDYLSKRISSFRKTLLN